MDDPDYEGEAKAVMSDWISVYDRKPERGIYVLAYWDGCYIVKYKGNDIWMDEWDDVYSGMAYWMQLPEPPEVTDEWKLTAETNDVETERQTLLNVSTLQNVIKIRDEQVKELYDTNDRLHRKIDKKNKKIKQQAKEISSLLYLYTNRKRKRRLNDCA